ncbi:MULTISPECIES: hypothetical protein [unclassified Caulobacter]|uniref:hypothetical protein n=1 Tax=unclassified Caulobacter TaxID=2648921 RepID=UPI0018EEA4B0|nr:MULTISPECIES: hypothetical protein [unclassified Caulobacter]
MARFLLLKFGPSSEPRAFVGDQEASHPAAHEAGKEGGEVSTGDSAADRSASARKAAATRKRNAEQHAHP